MRSMSPPRVAHIALAASLAVGLASISTAHATSVTFAQVIQQDGAAQQWAITTSGTTTTITASGAVLFSFSGVAGLPFAGPESATFNFSATSNSLGNCGVNCGAGDSFVQAGYVGTFSYTDTGANPGTNLLSGTFAVTGSPSTTGAQFGSHIGSSGGSFDASATLGNLNQLTFASSYVNFIGQTNENASFSLSSLSPNFAVGAIIATQAYPASGSFNAAGSSTFSSNPGPQAAPEPASIALFGVGLLGLCVVMRARRPGIA